MPPKSKRKATSPAETPKSIKKASNNTTKRSFIDMSHVPESLKREGYDKEFLKEEVIPDYLKCPSCKELFVNPEMFGCGHSICSICLQSRTSDNCPVCKVPSYNRIPNYIVKELLSREYAEEQEKRNKELEELKGLKDKLQQYRRSTRFMKILHLFNDFISKSLYSHYKTVISHLIASTKDITPSLREEELTYFLACVLQFQEKVGVIGQYLVDRSLSVEEFLTTIESKKKGITENKKWIPLMLICLTQSRFHQYDSYKRLGQIYKLDIGDELPLEEWRGRPAFWLKEIELDTSPECILHDTLGRILGHHDGFTSSSEESDEDDIFW